MRASEAALALFARVNSQGETEFLTQWNQPWRAYSLIGGHVEKGESFRQCCVREIEEELRCTSVDYEMAPYPYATLNFREFSKAAREESNYHWQVFLARLSSELLGRLPDDCQWVQAHHIRSGRTADGEAIADQVRRVLKASDNAEFDLFVSYGHAGDQIKALGWWQRSHDILQGMVHRGLHVSPEDLGFLEQIKSKLGEEPS